jgi:hypothetical protein
MELREAMWKNDSSRLDKARDLARIVRNSGGRLSANSIMLSAYITALGGKPVEGNHTARFFLFAFWHAFCLLLRWGKLNHNELDVLIQFLLKFRSLLPFVTTGQPSRWYRWHNPFDLKIMLLANAGVAKTIDAAVYPRYEIVLPHQTALARMTYAEVRYAVDFNEEEVFKNVQFALDLENKIRAETDQPQGLRQLVRIFRKAGELFAKMASNERNLLKKDDAYRAELHLNQALELATGEAKTPDQAEKIRIVLQSLQHS